MKEQEDEACDNDNEDRRQPQQEVKEDVAAALMTGRLAVFPTGAPVAPESRASSSRVTICQNQYRL